MYLIDTNIFLEILLLQGKKDICKEFLLSNNEQIYLSDFSLHSIGVILFRNNKETVFNKFVKDIIQKIKILTLSEKLYSYLSDVKEEYGLDFDDAYQFKVAEEYGLSIVTQDKDFEKVIEQIEIVFL